MAETVVTQHTCPISGTGIIRNYLNKKITALTTPKINNSALSPSESVPKEHSFSRIQLYTS
jgi:hypothetical protein